MARGQKQNDDLLMEDELAAAFLSDDAPVQDAPVEESQQSDDSWEEEEAMPGQLAVDVYETD